jgi:hypothetical protein
MATPFVQGRLREAPLSCAIRTECGHCRRPIAFELDRELNHRILEGPADPLIFLPFVDFPQLKDPSIIDAF